MARLQTIQKWLARLDWYLILLLALTLLALTPLTTPGYFYEAHDGRHSVFYLEQFDASLRSGALWPRWAMHHIQGYGYPTFLIQAPIGFYLGSLFVALGAGYTLAVKGVWATGFLVGAWGLYQLVRTWLEEERTVADKRPPAVVGLDPLRLCAVIAGLLYVFLPYHFVDIYVRAALNDTLLLAWFPWVFLLFDRLIILGGAAGWTRRLALAMLALAGTLLTHTFALISFAPLLVTFVIFLLFYGWRHFRPRKRGVLGRVVLAGVAGSGALLLTMIFLLPLLVEGRYLDQQVYVTNTYDFRRHFVQFGQFFSPFWGFGYSDDPVGANDGMSFQVGVMALLLLIMTPWLTWSYTRLRWRVGYLWGGTLALLWLMTPWASPLWEALPPLAVIQFPWRLLALVILLLSALGGLVLYQLLAQVDLVTEAELQEKAVGLLLVVILVVWGSASYIDAHYQPVEPWREDGRAVYQFEQEHPDMIAYTEWVQERPFTTSPMSDDYADPDYTEVHGATTDLTRLSITRGVGEVLRNDSRGSSFGGVVEIERPATVRVNLYYFPGWQVTVDGVPALYRIAEPYGLIEVDVPVGEHYIAVRMGTTPIRQVGAFISGGLLLVGLILLFWPVRRNSTA
ncbi:MAG: hypothetical protein R3C14_02050 [Caldilineaceae bacterium]